MSESHTISFAINTLTPLLSALETAYWDSSEIPVKDRIFDLVTSLHGELNELAKLSVNDLHMPYEPITQPFAESCQKLSYLLNQIDDSFPRSSTSDTLRRVLPQVASMLTNCKL